MNNFISLAKLKPKLLKINRLPHILPFKSSGDFMAKRAKQLYEKVKVSPLFHAFSYIARGSVFKRCLFFIHSINLFIEAPNAKLILTTAVRPKLPLSTDVCLD